MVTLPHSDEVTTEYIYTKILYFKGDVKSVLRILSAHNKNNCRGPTVGILIKLKL